MIANKRFSKGMPSAQQGRASPYYASNPKLRRAGRCRAWFCGFPFVTCQVNIHTRSR
jgi:hypothetical protein